MRPTFDTPNPPPDPSGAGPEPPLCAPSISLPQLEQP